ncbi:MAG: potassium-transporting ATPase subunit KdpA [Bacteroidota bacterium]
MIQYYEWLQVLLFFGMLIVISPVLGKYIASVAEGKFGSGTGKLGEVEGRLFRSAGISSFKEMNWKEYTASLLIFNFIGFIFLLVLQMCQAWLPLNPQKLPNVGLFLAINTAVSFVTNTNWQSYAGETTLSYLSQVLGLAVQNFLSAATGMAVLFAFLRGLLRKNMHTLGNFYTDVTRIIIYVLLPLSIILAVVLIGQGTVQTFSGYQTVHTLEGAVQTVPLGPAASQVAIKQLGTNGGGFFNTNSAFPYENPTPLSNFLQMFAILLIPSALVFTFGSMAGKMRQAWVLFGVMLFLLAAGFAVSIISETGRNEIFQIGGGMEGKESRFGVINSILWSVVTTAASNGSVNAMHSSLSPLSGLVTVLNIQLGEIIFGGVGSGLYGMFLFVILTVFISGLMIGRTPEYLGKKIEAYEIRLTIIAILIPNIAILLLSAIALSSDSGLSGIANKGPHGFTEILYAFSSAAGNNGSAFAGLNCNTDFYNGLLSLAMIAGRYGIIIPVIMIAGHMAGKNITPDSPGMLHTDTPLFAVLLMAIIMIVGALTFFPALSLGPVLEHLLISRGITF